MTSFAALGMPAGGTACLVRVPMPMAPNRGGGTRDIGAPMPMSLHRTAPAQQQANGSEDMSADSVLEKVIAWVAPHDIKVRDYFLTFDRELTSFVSKSQFARVMQLVGIRLNVSEVDLLAHRFAKPGQSTPDFQLNYERFVEVVEKLLEPCDSPKESPSSPTLPRSIYNFGARTCHVDWSHNSLSPVKKLQSKVVEKRLRLYDQFQDFDPLRKGLCCKGQVKTVFTIVNLDKELSPDDFKALQDCYTRDGDMFCYVDFCNDIDLAFTKRGLEMDPMTQLRMPDASSTLPARRSRQVLSAESTKRVFDLEEKLRARVRFRRCHLRSTFQDMDRTRRGHVTRSQFARIMCMLDFELTTADVDTLCLVYCDMGNDTEFNYVEFCASCDGFETAEPMSASPRKECYPKYFDCFGQRQAPIVNSPRSPRSPHLLFSDTSPRSRARAIG